MEEFVTIAEVSTDESTLMKAILEGHGITVFIADEYSSSMWTHVAVPARVQVAKDQVAEAQEILESIKGNEDDNDDDFDDESE